MLSDLNRFAAEMVPSQGWDALQLILGAACAFMCHMERAWSQMFQTSAIKCSVKWFSVRVGQVANWALFVLALALVYDAVLPPPTPPRTLLMIFLVIAIGRQVAGLHTAWERRSRTN